MKKIIALIGLALMSSSLMYSFFGYEECGENYRYSYNCTCVNGCARCR